MAALRLACCATLYGCGGVGSGDLRQLTQLQGADDRTAAGAAIGCDSIDPVCARLYLEQGAACARLTEAPAAAERAAMRDCAVRAFRRSAALTPAGASLADRLAAERGLANALKIARDNAADAAAASEAASAMVATLPGLAALPGGGQYAAYYGSDLALDGDPDCTALRGAAAGLPSGRMPADLSPRVAALREAIARTLRRRSCP